MEKAVLAHSSNTEDTSTVKLEEELEKCNIEMHERKYAGGLDDVVLNNYADL